MELNLAYTITKIIDKETIIHHNDDDMVEVECLLDNVIIVLIVLGGGIVFIRIHESYICERESIMGINTINYKPNVDLDDVLAQGLNFLTSLSDL
jgi:NAD kinase